MSRKIAAITLFLAATAAFAQRGHVVSPVPPIPGTTVSGIVFAVGTNSVSLANGLVTIDITGATITDDHGAAATVTKGDLIFAILKSNTSLQASTVVVTKQPQVTLSGTVQSVNPTGGTLQVLGLPIHADANTSFGGGHNVHSLADIVANDLVIVQANAVGMNLVAASILVFSPMPLPFTLIHGTVKSIGTQSWVITNTSGKDVTVLVNAQTKILGSPKVGDTVDVLANTDAANNYVAISIAVSPETPPPMQMHINGVVKSIGATQWVIGPAAGLGPDFLVQITADTKIVGNPQVGDHVEAVVQTGHNGFVAISITKI